MSGESCGEPRSGGEKLAIADAFARAQAYIADSLVMIVPAFLGWYLLRSWLDSVDYFGFTAIRNVFELMPPQLSLGPLGIVFPFFMVFALMLMETATHGKTVGKKLSGLRVVTTRGAKISRKQAVVRNLLRVLDMLPTLYVLGLATMASDRLRRRIGDKVAGTVVIVENYGEEVLPFMRKPVSVAAEH